MLFITIYPTTLLPIAGFQFALSKQRPEPRRSDDGTKFVKQKAPIALPLCCRKFLS